MARGFHWSRSINMPNVSGWPNVGEYGSVGWTSGGTVQTGSGADFVNVVGAGVLDTPSQFVLFGTTGLEYSGSGGAFFVTAQINLDNPEAEETPIQMRLARNGNPIANSTLTVIHTANAIDELVVSSQVTLANGDEITAQVQNLGGATDLTSTYFRLQALRVG